MVILESKILSSIDRFCLAIEMVEEGEEVLIRYSPGDISSKLVDRFKLIFPWHYNDTQRSYTSQKLRPHGNRGKKKDFAYLHRVTRYFGYDQFDAQYRQPNKLICLWDPTEDGDFVGEHNPCLVMIKLKQRGDRLHMTAIYRKRDLCRRMIGNMNFLCLWLNENAKKWGLKPGTITDFSMDTRCEIEDIKRLRGK